MRTLEVWLHDVPVGRIVENRKGARFSYAQEICDSSPGLPLLSLCLPVKARPFGEARTADWFEGLLPEGRRRDAACRQLGLSPYDWIGLLAEIGWECAGAVRVFEQGDERGEPGGYRPFAEGELAAKLADLDVHLPAPAGGAYRMSLGGYQDKMCVAMPRLQEGAARASAIVAALPYGDAPSTHILKPEPRAYPGAAESEAWAMTVAGHAARCSNVALLDLADAPPTLVVERYDRGGEGWPHGAVRIHQEDACQALGLPPNRKYASAAGRGDDPTYRAIADLLLRYSSAFEEEASELLRQVTVNLVLGNWDAHAKNLSLLHPRRGAPVLAPMYDVVPVAEVEPRTAVLSLRIDGSLEPGAITKSRVLAEAVSWGLDPDLARQVYEDCLAGIERGFEAAGKRYPNAAERHGPYALTRLEKLA